MFYESKIKAGLDTVVFGRKEIFIFKETDSTNDRAFNYAEKSSPEGTIVIAESQNSGKGRHGRKWISVPGSSISLSIILRPRIQLAEAPGLTLVLAVALSDTLHGFNVHNHRIKWPNDILINNKKISGILTEMKAADGEILFVIAGTGINIGPVSGLLPENLKETATSIFDETGIMIDRTDFLRHFLYNLESRYNQFLQSGLTGLLKVWEENSDIKGRTVSAIKDRKPVKGKVLHINNDGSLTLETDSGPVIINSGEISIH
ncbi:MAG: biotin--[acetyl-CoA-carboxylase] ligase [Spirochaetes bacterium]|nr:biotin--[acetyl-CoA-carboxylase] ligase [Spirochaetota bacterium]